MEVKSQKQGLFRLNRKMFIDFTLLELQAAEKENMKLGNDNFTITEIKF